jgi:hypothetical protein
MTNMQRLVIVLAFIFALLVGVLLATTLLSGGGPSATPGPSSTTQAQASTSPGGSVPPTSASPAASDGGSAAPGASDGGGASPSASASASPSPSPTPKPLANAVVTVNQLKLDAATDTAGADRVISWVASGTGSVTATLSSLSTDGSQTKMCLSANGKALGCRTGTGGKLPATTSGTGVRFSLTLRGVAAATPVVAVKVSFPAVHPAATISGARFDGTGFPDTNGIQVVVQPRVAGKVKLVAAWGGHPFLYEIDLIEQGGGGLQTLPNQGPATKVTQSLAIPKGNAWMLVLQNIEAGMGVTPLTATISWP